MRHMNIREMACREAQLNGEQINVDQVEGRLDPSDLLTKEHKTRVTFIHQLCNLGHPEFLLNIVFMDIYLIPLKEGRRAKGAVQALQNYV
jgi:hypothetical protein